MKTTFLLIAILIGSVLVAQTKIAPEDAQKYMGEKVTVYGKITGAVYKNSTKQTFLNIGPSAFSTTLTVLINAADKKNFSYSPETYLVNRNIFLTGRIVDVGGTPSLLISRPEEIKLEEGEDEIEIRALGFDALNKFFEED